MTPQLWLNLILGKIDKFGNLTGVKYLTNSTSVLVALLRRSSNNLTYWIQWLKGGPTIQTLSRFGAPQGIFQRRLGWSEIKKGSWGSTLAFIRIRTRIDRKPPLPELHTTLLGLCNISVYLWNVCECVLVYECVHTRELIDRNLWGFLSAVPALCLGITILVTMMIILNILMIVDSRQGRSFSKIIQLLFVWLSLNFILYIRAE